MKDQVAAVVVQQGDRVLLLKRAITLDWAPGKWCFPSGHVDPGETPLEAAVRETHEEADLYVSGLRHLMAIDLPGRHITCFRAEDPGTDVGINDESSDWAWVPIAEVSGYDTTPDVPQALEALSMSQRVAARFKKKKEVPSEDGGKTTVYEYSDRQVALRNTEKAKRIEKLRKSYSSLEGQVKKDLASKDNETFLTALAVALMDETYERVGNDGSAAEGHFGVIGWRREHVNISGGTATVTYVGKSGVRQKKTISGPVVKHLQKAYDAVASEGDKACIFCPKEGKVDAPKINDYLAKFDITAKDLRGYHANDAMKRNLKKVRSGELPSDPKEREKKLKDEYKQALETTAKEVGHEPSTLNSQYLVPGLEDDYMKDGTVSEKMTKEAAARVAVRFLAAAEVVQISGPWVDKMRKDFLVLMKNIPRIKDYKDAHRVKEAMKIWNNRFSELFFERFLNKGLKYDRDIKEDVRGYIDHLLRKPAWDFHLEMTFPIGHADDYWSEEARFSQYEREVKKWSQRVRRKAQVFWKAVREAVHYYEDPENKIRYKGQNEPPTLQVEMPSSDRAVVEGFQLIMKGYDPSESSNRVELEMLKEGLKTYRANASKRLPILLQKQLPVVVEFEATLDKGGEYNRNGTITFYASSAYSKGPKWVSHAMAHEMGHHLWRAVLSGAAQEFWTTAIKGDYGDLDIQHLLDNWPGDAWAFQFSEKLGDTDPLLALQVEALSHDRAYGGRDGLQTKEDFQKLLDEGQRTIRVPKTPISGYANKNPEEAFCEAIGLLVTYGPRAVHEKIRGWLNIVLPGQVKMAQRIVDRWAADKIRAYKVMHLDGNELVAGANSRLRFPARKGVIRMPGNGVYMSPNKRYVLDYYSGLADNEVLLTLEFDKADIKWGNLTDREAEVAASPVRIIDIEPLDD